MAGVSSLPSIPGVVEGVFAPPNTKGVVLLAAPTPKVLPKIAQTSEELRKGEFLDLCAG